MIWLAVTPIWLWMMSSRLYFYPSFLTSYYSVYIMSARQSTSCCCAHGAIPNLFTGFKATAVRKACYLCCIFGVCLEWLRFSWQLCAAYWLFVGSRRILPPQFPSTRKYCMRGSFKLDVKPIFKNSLVCPSSWPKRRLQTDGPSKGAFAFNNEHVWLV